MIIAGIGCILCALYFFLCALYFFENSDEWYSSYLAFLFLFIGICQFVIGLLTLGWTTNGIGF